MTPRPYIRIVNDEALVEAAKVIHVTTDSKGHEVETDISSCVQRIEVDLEVGSVARATVHAIFAHTDARAEINDVLLTAVPARCIPDVIDRLKEQLASGVTAGTVDVTTLGDHWLRYMPEEPPVA